MSREPVGEDITPSPDKLIESLRDFGYTMQSAIADLVDNSITAQSSSIAIHVQSEGDAPAHIAIVDDGVGMRLDVLIEAMKLGSMGPFEPRRPSDLGRFGLGLKTASLSQGRCLTVITKQEGDKVPVSRILDIDHIRKMAKWELLLNGSPAIEAYREAISKRPSGTVVLIERLDRASFLQVKPDQLDQHLGRTLDQLRLHLEMVFHRFLERGLEIRLGIKRLDPWDPFLRGRSIELDDEPIPQLRYNLGVRRYILPHHSKFATDEEHARAGGIHGWNAHQGYYIYRADRLIVPGTWLGMFKKEEHHKLARLTIDLTNQADDAWHLNVMKSHVAAPAALRDDLKRLAEATRREAVAVYRHRGERQAPTAGPPERHIWKRKERGTTAQYRIDRTHPVVQSLLHQGCEHEHVLESLLQLVEQSLPIAALLQEPAKALDGSGIEGTPSDLDRLVDLARHASTFLVRAGKSPADARTTVMGAEPFQQFRDLILPRL